MSGLNPREDILALLFQKLQNITGMATAWRNRANLPEESVDGIAQRPAVILLDGDMRSLVSSEEIYARKSVRMRALPMILTPEIWIILPVADSRINITLKSQPYSPGTELSNFEFQIRAAIENQDDLIALLTPNGQIVYAGIETDLKTGGTIGTKGAHARMKYDFYFPLFPPSA